MTVHLISNLSKDPAAKTALRAAQILAHHGASCLLSEELNVFASAEFLTANPQIRILPQEDCYKNADILITVGGDGTILHVATCSLAYQKPILGINLGRCGFLATCEESELEEKLALVAARRYMLDSRMLLCAAGGGHNEHALNDIVISKEQLQQTIDCSVYCDDILVETYRCDGLIFATPTGSTAYSLAAGGPIVDSQTRGIVLTPICPHSLRSPSMVFAPERKLRVVIGDNQRDNARLSCDGNDSTPLAHGETVEITLCEKTVQLITFGKADQFYAIDRKLKNRT